MQTDMRESPEPSTSERQSFWGSLAYYNRYRQITDEEKWVQAAIDDLIKTMKTHEQNPNPSNQCINIPKIVNPHLGKELPQVITYGVWRCSDLQTTHCRRYLGLKPLDHCFSAEQMEICLNPAHFGAPPTDPQKPDFWGSIAYHEYDSRVGEVFRCHSTTITVDGFTDPCIDNPDRFCLGLLTNADRDSVTQTFRQQIGEGICVRYLNGLVFVECLSDASVFVQSPYHNRCSGDDVSKVTMIAPFHYKILHVFHDHGFAQLLSESVKEGFEAVCELAKMCTIRISFVKSWGGEDSITSTPCWVELRLNRQLRWLDNTLKQMGAPYKLYI